MKSPDPENVDMSSDAEQLDQVSCTDRRSTIAGPNRLLKETVGNDSARLPETSTICSASEIVPPPDDTELPKEAVSSNWVQTADPFSFNTPLNSIDDSTGWGNFPLSTSIKKSKKNGRRVY